LPEREEPWVVPWLLLSRWWLALGHLVSGVLFCLTVIEHPPLRVASSKRVRVSLLPLGREIVSIEQARARGIAPELLVPEGAGRPSWVDASGRAGLQPGRVGAEGGGGAGCASFLS
jgi:hypothetical protein